MMLETTRGGSTPTRRENYAPSGIKRVVTSKSSVRSMMGQQRLILFSSLNGGGFGRKPSNTVRRSRRSLATGC
jgi:hypothetical protein